MKRIGITAVVISTMLFAQLVYAQILGGRASETAIVTAAQIRSLQADRKFAEKFVIVDVRAKSETDVSMIPAAITKRQFERTQAQHAGKTVLVYCTVGYRSGIYASKLSDRGWTAFNYKGSILDWCNHQLPVVTPDGKNTKRVHTYSSKYPLAQGYQAVF